MKQLLIDFMMWMAINDKKPYQNYEEVVNEYLSTEAVKNNAVLPHVIKSMPADKCVEKWWAEGQDEKQGFWHEAPYRTNGDVIEEIKTALKYFIETWQGNAGNYKLY